MNRVFQLRYWSAILAVIALTGCGSGVDQILEQTVEQTYKIDPDAAISIRNGDGSIEIYGANTKELKLEAVKKAYRQDRLQGISINVKAQPNLVAIETIFPPKPKFALSDRSGTVDYHLVVPQTCTITRAELNNGEIRIDGLRGQSAHANLVNGRLVSHNCFSDIQVFVANGALEISYDWWENRRFAVDAKIVNGNTHAAIPGQASFHLVAGTTDGEIANDFTEQADRRGDHPQKVDALVGQDSNVDIHLQATTGNIEIAESNP